MNTFFSKELVVEHEDYYRFLKQICTRSTQNNNAIYCVNFLHHMNSDIPIEEKQKLHVYTQSIGGEGMFSWNLTSGLYECSDDITRWFANESTMIFNGMPILSHRKSSYYNESDQLMSQKSTEESANYYHGFGADEISDGLEEAHQEVALALHQNASMEICWDIQKHIRAWRKALLNTDISFAAERIVQNVNALRTVLFQYPTFLDQYKLCIRIRIHGFRDVE